MVYRFALAANESAAGHRALDGALAYAGEIFRRQSLSPDGASQHLFGGDCGIFAIVRHATIIGGRMT
jgi:hypothetical protein